MKLSLDWINERLDLGHISSSKLNYISQRLIDGGFEIEDTYQMSGSIILEISAPANLTEHLSIFGMTKELSLLLNKPYRRLPNKVDLFSLKENQENLNVLIEENTLIKNKDIRALGITLVKNIENLKTPDWMKERLKINDIKVTNTIIDYQNYILLETGYAFEFYDLDKIQKKTKSNKLSFKIIKNNSEYTFFKASNDQDYVLENSTLIVKVNDNLIGLAGMLPCKSVECTNQTKSLLIESSIFTPSSMRMQTRLTGCKTERSIRYEKDINTYGLEIAHNRLIELLLHNNSKAEYSKNKKIIQNLYLDSNLELTHAKFIEVVNNLELKDYPVKNNLSTNLISEYLTRLNYDYTYNLKEKSWVIKIPGYKRSQITRPIHLVQQISCIHGFDKFSAILPTNRSSGNNDKTYKLKLMLSSYLLDLGINEFINYSINNKNDDYRDVFSVINPINTDQKKLQNSLIVNILQSVLENLKNGNNYISGFEFGHTFSLLSDIPITKENEFVSGIFFQKKFKNLWELNNPMENWLDVKGPFEKLFQQLGIKTKWESLNFEQYNKFLNSKTVSSIMTESGQLVGVIGQLHPFYSKNFPEYKNLFLFELNLDVIKLSLDETKLLTSYEYSKHPTIVTNVSFKSSLLLNCEIFKKLILINGTNILKNVKTLNVITKKDLIKDTYFYTFMLIFQSDERTLAKNEVVKIVQSIEKKISHYMTIVGGG